MKKKIVSKCPICAGEMAVTRLSCQNCDTHVESVLGIPPFFRLPVDLQEFVLLFLGCRGNIREMERALGVSYPTVCKRLDLVNEILNGKEPEPYPANAHVAAQSYRSEVLDQLERGDITAQQAVALLRGR